MQNSGIKASENEFLEKIGISKEVFLDICEIYEWSEEKKKQLMAFVGKEYPLKEFYISHEGNTLSGESFSYYNFFGEECERILLRPLRSYAIMFKSEFRSRYGTLDDISEDMEVEEWFESIRQLVYSYNDIIRKIENNYANDLESELCKVEGLGFGIFTSSILNAMYYTAVNEGIKLKQQNEIQRRFISKDIQRRTEVEVYYRLLYKELLNGNIPMYVETKYNRVFKQYIRAYIKHKKQDISEKDMQEIIDNCKETICTSEFIDYLINKKECVQKKINEELRIEQEEKLQKERIRKTEEREKENKRKQLICEYEKQIEELQSEYDTLSFALWGKKAERKQELYKKIEKLKMLRNNS